MVSIDLRAMLIVPSGVERLLSLAPDDGADAPPFVGPPLAPPFRSWPCGAG